MTRISQILLFSLLLFLTISCSSDKKKQKSYSAQEVQEALLAYNKRLADNIKTEINSFIESSADTFKKAEEGYYYRIVKEGNGVYPQINMQVSCIIKYSLLNGTLCYPEKQDEITEFVVGENTVSILNHSVQKVDVGGEIQAVVSPFMGFGLNGDGKNIPPARAILVNISLLKVNNGATK